MSAGSVRAPNISVTAEDVAEAAGVSRWTVARAFKTDASISKATRERVLAVATEFGYEPDLYAAGLAAERSNIIALIFDDFENPHKLMILERLTRIIQSRGRVAILINSNGPAGAAEALKSASQRRVDAAVLIGTEFDQETLETALHAPRLKKLIIFARESSVDGTISLFCDDNRAMASIAGLLFRRGRSRPLYLSGPDTPTANLRRESLLQFELAKRDFGPAPVIHAGAYDALKAHDALVEYLKTPGRLEAIDSIVCENDILAIGAIDALRKRMGLRVPDDIAVVGYDDIALAASPSYRLTTYRQPISLLVEALVDILESNEEPKPKTVIEGRLVIRNTL